MKKCFPIFLFVIILLLTACGNDGPKASNKAISCAKEAVEIAEGYLSYDIDYDEANERLNELREDMEYVSEMSKDDEHYSADFSIQINLLGLSTALVSDNYKSSDETYDKIQEIIDELQEYIN
ncbi:MAG: hypothetical protein ACI4D1_10215 [Lachnospira sp.]